MISANQGFCEDCNKFTFLIAKRCKSCYWAHRASISADKKKIRGLGAPRTKKPVIEPDSDLEAWFDMVATFISAKPYCMECGKYVPPSYYRHATAHIFPKNIFRSIETHPLNWLILPAGCCHDKTHRIDTFSKMKVWGEACRRFKIMEPHITETHKYLDIFKSHILKHNNGSDENGFLKRI